MSGPQSAGGKKKRTIIRWCIRKGPFGITILLGWDPFRRENFTATVFASQGTWAPARERISGTAWTDRGKIKLKGPGVFVL
jgi:hypothetical protein